MIQIISDSPAHSTGTDALWEEPLDASTQQVSLEWIQSLSPELKDAALYRLCKVVEAKPTLVESFTLNQVLYRTISSNTFTESSENVASRTGCDRKTILKGLHQAVEQNILEETKRPGTSNEYSFKPVEEWLPEPVRNKDTQKIEGDNLVQFPTEIKQDIVETEPVPIMDDLETDSNDVVINNLKEQQQEVSVPVVDNPSIWRRLPSGNRYAQIPPIHDQETGVEIQRQMDSEGLTAQSVVTRAIALTKVPLMLLELWANIGSALANSCLKAQSEPKSKPEEVLVSQCGLGVSPSGATGEPARVSLQLSKTLEMIGVNLSPRQLQKCVCEYGEDVMLNAASELKRTGVLTGKGNPTGYFIGCLKNGLGQQPAAVHNALQDEEEQQKAPKCNTTEMGQAMKPVASFSHAETNPRVTVARLILDGQYERGAILAGLYRVDYEELVRECGVDDPSALIMVRKVTN